MGALLKKDVDSAPTSTVSGRIRLGRVVANTGRDILVMIDTTHDARTAVRLGDMVVIAGDGQSTVGVVSGMNAPAPGLESDADDLWIAQVELAGTLGVRPGEPTFKQSIPFPPALGDVAYKASPTDLRRLFRNGDDTAYPFGVILGQHDVAATIDGHGLVEGGFSIIGASGSGKSCTMASIVRALLRHRHAVTTILIDPHNEYARSFGKAAVCIRPEPGLLPHWLLSFEELTWVLSSNGGPLEPDECSILEEAVPAARMRFMQRGSLPRDNGGPQLTINSISVDAPLPYRVADIVGHLDKAVTQDEARDSKAYRRLRNRIMVAVGDPRFSVLFGNVAATDSLANLIRRVFRMEENGPPMTVLQLGSLSGDVDKLVVSVICRLATALAEWGDSKRQTLLLIDDATRYAPQKDADSAAQLSLSALINLGGRPRKLGTTLGLGVGDSRAISRDVVGQCSTYFIHRISSQLEIDAVEDMLPEAAGAFLGGVSNLGTGEAIGVGKGVPLAGRIAIAPLPDAAIPSEFAAHGGSSATGQDDVALMVHRWRTCGTVEWSAAVPPETTPDPASPPRVGKA